MNETRNHILQAIQFAKEENPNDMQDSLGAVLSNKITDAINLKKIELAGEFFGEKNEDEEDENGSEEEEENGKKKKKNPFAKKKNGDDDDEDDDEEEDVDEGAIGDAAKAVGSSVVDAARTATHKPRLSRTRQKYHSARKESSWAAGDKEKAEKHEKKADEIGRYRKASKADQSVPGQPEATRRVRRLPTTSTRK
jgi:hypothetical protein